jgi:hypothetical protein
MTEQTSLFASLPEMLFPLIFEFANDGAMRLVYHPKKKCFVEKINKNFTLLKKALQFKIDNPPYWDVDDPNFDFEIGTTELDMIENLTFKYPLKLRLREGCRDQFFTNDGYLELMFSFTKSFNSYTTTKCEIALPMYYHQNIGRVAAHYKNQCKKKLSKKDFYHSKYMYKNFKTFKNSEDVVFC